jgi:hypothetical protein
MPILSIKASLCWDDPAQQFGCFLTQIVHEIALAKSIPAQIRQLILRIGNNQG